jgi:hypothetical protein
MDVNGTRYHLLTGEQDWGSCVLDGRVGHDAGAAAVGLLATPFLYSPNRRAGVLAPVARRGAARDRYGSWYAVGDDLRTILVTSAGSGETTPFWPVADRRGLLPGQVLPPAVFAPVGPPDGLAPSVFGGLAVTEDDLLVVGVLDPPGLVVFDLLGGGPPVRRDWARGLAFAPVDVVARGHGGVFVLDTAPWPGGDGGPGAAATARVWELDRALSVVSRAAPSRPGIRPRVRAR